MENIEHDELQALKQRVDVLEQQMKNLGKLFAQMGQQLTESVAEEVASQTVASGKTFSELKPVANQAAVSEVMVKKFIEKAPSSAIDSEYTLKKYPLKVAVLELKNTEPAVKEGVPENEPTKAVMTEPSAEDEMSKNVREFIENYTSGSTEFEPWDVAQNVVKNLTKFLDWNQVPDDVKKGIYLVEAYESNMYYASSYDSDGEYIYLVAPADRDSRYTQRQLIRLGLPAFYDISYAADLGGQSLKLIEPAVFLQEIKNGKMIYVLKKKGKLILAR